MASIELNRDERRIIVAGLERRIFHYEDALAKLRKLRNPSRLAVARVEGELAAATALRDRIEAARD